MTTRAITKNMKIRAAEKASPNSVASLRSNEGALCRLYDFIALLSAFIYATHVVNSYNHSLPLPEFPEWPSSFKNIRSLASSDNSRE